MSNITSKRLGDIVNFKRGYDLTQSQRKKGPYPVISSSGISGFHSDYKCDGEGLVTGRYGTLGEMYYYNGKYWPHNTTLYATTFYSNHPKYVYYLLKCLGNLKTSDKSTVPGINRNDLHEINIPFICDKVKQELVASVLSSLDAKIELNKRINSELEQMAKTIFDYWFVQFDFPDEQGKPYKSSGGKMVYHPKLKRDIPERWRMKHLGDLVYPVNDSIEPHEYPELNYLPIDKLPTKKLYYEEYDERSNAQSSLIRFKEDDILLGAMRVYFHRVCNAIEDGISRSTLIVLRPFEHICKNYSLFTLNRNEAIDFATKNSTGTSIPYAKWNNGLKEYKVCTPPDDKLLLKFNLVVNPILDKFKILSKQNLKLASLRNWLLPMLMNGQVTVKEAVEKVSELGVAAEPEAKYKTEN